MRRMQIRYHITGDLVFVDGNFSDGNTISASMSEQASGGRGRINEILCVGDGTYLSATGGARAGGRNRWPMDDESVTRDKLRDVCVPGLKPPFDADEDVRALRKTRVSNDTDRCSSSSMHIARAQTVGLGRDHVMVFHGVSLARGGGVSLLSMC